MTLNHRFLIVAITLLFLFSGCDKASPTSDDHGRDDHAAEAQDEHDDHAGETGADEHGDEAAVGEFAMALTPAELTELDIKIATAGSLPITITKHLSGEIVMNPDGIAHVVVRASGVVQEVFKTIGDTVSAGDPLAVLDSPALAEAKGLYLSRNREYELAKLDLVRAETVYENTRRLLEFLSDRPELDTLRVFSDQDLGENRRILMSAYTQLVASEVVYNRERSLFEKQIGSESEYLEAESAFKQAQATFFSVRDDVAFGNTRTLSRRQREAQVAEVVLLAADRNLHALGLSGAVIETVAEQTDEELARYVITAPLDGVITERHIVRGEQMEQGDDIYIVADLSTVWAHLTVYPKDLSVLRVGQPAEIVAEHGIGQARGEIQYISPVFSESTRTTTARIVLTNPDGGWRPGLFVTGRVVIGTFEPRVVVPKTALQTIEDNQIIFVLTPHGFEPFVVLLGRINGTHVEIVKGLEPGDEYVAVGGFALKAELGKASFDGDGHGH